MQDDDLITDGSAADDEEDHGETGHRRMSEGEVIEIEKDEQKLAEDVDDDPLDNEDENGEEDEDEETDDEFDAEDDEDE